MACAIEVGFGNILDDFVRFGDARHGGERVNA